MKDIKSLEREADNFLIEHLGDKEFYKMEDVVNVGAKFAISKNPGGKKVND